MDNNSGKVLIILSPSGGGKNTIIKELIKKDSKFVLNISYTTRCMRDGEKDGVDYFFKTKEDFKKMLKENRLLEHEEYSGNLYGTSRDFIDEKLKEGKIVICQVEWRGALSIKKAFGNKATSIFIMPPSFEELRKRLELRGANTPEDIERRLETAKIEISNKDRYDHIVINDDLDRAVDEVYNLVK